MVESVYFHPEDLWYNSVLLKEIENYRNVKGCLIDGNPVLLHKKKFLTFKIKYFCSKLNDEEFAKISSFSKQKHAPIMEFICSEINVTDNRAASLRISEHHTIVINLKNDLNEIFASIDQKRRNQINKSIKEKVEVTVSQERDEFEAWWDIYVKTSQRGDFVLNNKEMLAKFIQLGLCRLFLAKLEGKIIAGNIVIFNNYPFWWIGASEKEYSKYNAPSLLQWEVIKYAKEKNYSIYDMGGINISRTEGPERFKSSFNGEIQKYYVCEKAGNILAYKTLNMAKHFYYKILKKETF